MAADEVRHLKDLGLRTGMLLAARVELPLWDEGWEPLWEAAAETGLPIGFHLGGGLRTVVESGPRFNDPGNMGVRVACATLQMDEPLAAVIFSGRSSATPGSRSSLAETGIGWLPYMLERMDDTYRKFLDAGEFWRTHGGLRLTMPPSAYFRRQVWATFQTDLVGLRVVDTLGENRVMWASDYPHPDSTWPASQQAIEENSQRDRARDAARILCDNAKEPLRVVRKVRSRVHAPDPAAYASPATARKYIRTRLQRALGDTASPRQRQGEGQHVVPQLGADLAVVRPRQ